MPGEWLSLSEIADELGVHPSTIRNWADQGRLPVHRTQGGHRRFRRSEIEIWYQAQNASAPNEARMVIQNALGNTRVKISEGELEKEIWYQKLDATARQKYRESGRTLLHSMMNYISSGDDKDQSEARALGFEYASRGRRHQLSASEATRAFLFFRNSLIDAMLNVYEASAVESPAAWGNMYRKISDFTDKILLTIIETYEALERS
ncbi:MAG: helix-turn-helix domain-containing protein [Gammaproteobacteria bacterium]|nr:helix-turn-helix domain-containing protein [Gammaproteobacteria bacterium]